MYSDYMGVYRLAAERVFCYPSYTKVEGEKTHYLYHAGDGSGLWWITDRKDRIAQNSGTIKSASAAELPTQEGLQWKVRDKSDDAIACIDLRATTDRLKAMASSTKSNDQVSKVIARWIQRFATRS